MTVQEPRLTDNGPGPVVRTAAATLGQLSQWYEQFGDGTGQAQRNLPRAWTMEPPLPRDAVLTVLRELVRRHEGLRTTFARTADGGLVQRVHEDAVPPLAEVVMPDGVSDEERDERWRKPLLGHVVSTGFDLTAQWPVRFCLTLAADGTMHAVDSVVNHVAVDAWSSRIFTADLRALLRASASGAPTPPADDRLQPCDIAALESSPRGRERRERAVEFLRDQLRAVPTSLFPDVDAAAGSDDPKLLMTRTRDMACVILRSPALYHACRWLAHRHRLSVPALVLAPYTGLLAHYTGQPEIPVKAMVNNRFDTRTRDTVTCLTQPVLVSYRAGDDVPFVDLARRCYWAMLTSYRHARYDIQDAERLVVEEGVRRGAALNIERRFDFRDVEQDPAVPSPPTDGQLDVSPSTREFSGEHRVSGPELALLVQVERGLVTVAIWGDVACVPEATIDRMLSGVETTLVSACRDDATTIARTAASVGLEPVRVPAG